MQLRKKELVLLIAGGVAALLMCVLGFVLTMSQESELQELQNKEKSEVSLSDLMKRKSDKRRAGEIKLQIAKRKDLLKRLEKYVPGGADAGISHEEITASLPQHAKLLDAKVERAQRDLLWEPPRAAEEGADESEENKGVKYKEHELKFDLRADYGTWLQTMANLEKLQRFYRLKEVTIKSAQATSTATDTPLLINFKIGTYYGVEFPSKEKSEGS